MTTPSMSVIDDKGTAKLLLDLNGRDVLVTREQLEALEHSPAPEAKPAPAPAIAQATEPPGASA